MMRSLVGKFFQNPGYSAPGIDVFLGKYSILETLTNVYGFLVVRFLFLCDIFIYLEISS